MVSVQTPDNFTALIAIKACIGLRDFEYGKVIHGVVKKDEKSCSDLFVGSALIELYSTFGQMHEALKVFEEFDEPDMCLCTSMVTGYEKNGNPEEALAFFSLRMANVRKHADLDPVTLVSIVSTCTQIFNLKLGICVHGYVVRRSLDFHIPLINSLLNLYAKTGSVNSATNIFRFIQCKDVISWSSMIACYAQNEAASKALDLFNEMIDNKIEPNSVTLLSALQACAVVRDIEQGKKVHKLAAQKGLELDIKVSTALIDMYMWCLSPNEASTLFWRMPRRDVVAWIALLSGYALNGMVHESMGIFRMMLSKGVRPDAVAVVKVLAACSESGILRHAMCLHGYVVSTGFDANIFVMASLIELYSKCSSLDDAVKIFESTVERDVFIWSCMIAAFGIYGRGVEALQTFEWMVSDSAVRPNSVTFLSLLTACSHSGLIEKGIEMFNIMVHDYKLKPSSEHYAIAVDLFGRSGELEKAVDIINQMSVPAGPEVWGALLGACRIHQNIEIAEVAAEHLFQLDPEHAGYYLLLSNIYAMDGKWDGVAKLRSLIRRNCVKKMNGLSMVEVDNKIHSFLAGDKLHPNCHQIYGMLRHMDLGMREEGYMLLV